MRPPTLSARNSTWKMRRRLVLCTVFYLAAGNGCPRCEPVEEYCDVNQDRCSPCSRLCFPGQGTNTSCHRLCPEYVQTKARDSQLMLKPEQSTLSPLADQNQPILRVHFEVIIIGTAIVMLALLAAMIVFGVRRLHKCRANRRSVVNSSYFPCSKEEASQADLEANGHQEEGRRGRNLLCPGGPNALTGTVPSEWDSRGDNQTNNREWEMASSGLTPSLLQAESAV